MSETPVETAESTTKKRLQNLAISSKDKAVLDTINNLKSKFENEDQLRSFFTRPAFEKYWYVDIEEFREIFEETIDDEALGKIKKFWAEKNITYFNMSYELLWPIKWIPVAVRYATGLLRFRVMSMTLLFVYLEAVDFFLEPIALHYYKTRRLIKVSDGFDYHLTKGKYQEMRWRWFESYLNILSYCIQKGVKLGPDYDKKLLRRMNPKNESEEDRMFQTIDRPKTDVKKNILFKKEIDVIKRGDILEYVKSQFRENNLEKKKNSYIATIKDVYFEYKDNPSFPKRKDFETCLGPKYFPGERKLKFSEELARKVRTMANTIDYAIGKPYLEDFLTDIGVLPQEESTKKEKQKLALGNNYADFLLFSLIFIAPLRTVKVLREWKKMKYLMFGKNR